MSGFGKQRGAAPPWCGACGGRSPAGMRPGRIRAVGRLTLLILAAAWCVTGCGYRFSGSGELPAKAESVFVAILENRTAESGVEHIFTNDLIYELNRNGQRVVGRELADLALSGTIDAISIETVAYRGQTTSVERRVRAWLSLKLTDRAGRTVWSRPGLMGEEAYSVLDEKAATDYNKRLAIQSLSKRMAEEVFNRMTDAF